MMSTAAGKQEPLRVVSHDEWLEARKRFLAKEKEFTHQRDEMSRLRRELPFERVEKSYTFDGPAGNETLADLFGGKHQLVVYHFMLGPGWPEGCKSCSFIADQFDGMTIHLAHRDTSLAVISRATQPEIEAFKKRMGWKFTWVSSNGNDFNFDYGVSFTKEQVAQKTGAYNYRPAAGNHDELPGMSVFFKSDAGEVFHSYSTYGRGLDILLGTYNILDLTPKGRDEDGPSAGMGWVRHHDRYDDGQGVDPKQLYTLPAKS